MQTLYCPFRKESVLAQPEEIVRQKLLVLMTEQLGYPRECLVIEKALSKLPHLQNYNKPLPRRRVDILCYSRQSASEVFALKPLLLIECKAIPLDPGAFQQASGYNYYIGAPFIAIANESQIFHGWRDLSTGKFCYSDFLPFYKDLIDKNSKM